MKFNFTLFLFVLSFSPLWAQKMDKIAKLDTRLTEISGLSLLNDSTFVAHNDGGDEPRLYLLNKKGVILKTLLINNATNVDWEDITTDGISRIFIADLGNNKNDRRNLKIYIVDLKEVLNKTEVEAEIIEFKYGDQKMFPPTKDQLNYDCEGMAYKSDSLFIFTKCRTEPFTGYSNVYKIPSKAGSYAPEISQRIYLDDAGFYFSSVTAAEFFESTCYLLTYRSLYTYRYAGGQFEAINTYKLSPFSQKEALAIQNYDLLYVADEAFKLLPGRNLYQIKFKRTKKK